MKNPFASEVLEVSPEDEASAAGLLSPICDVTLSDDGAARIRGTIANALSATLAARPSNSAMRRVAFTSAAVAAPLMAVGAVGALTGSEPLAGPLDFVSGAVGLSSSEPPTATAAALVASASASATSSATASASPSASTTPGAGSAAGQGGGAAAAAAHTNEKGCDDVNPAVQGTPTPGGPVDCEVGNSADHRQNGKEHGKPTSTATAEASASASPSAAASSTASASEDAHHNGMGCDDVNPAVQGTPTPGGPVDCEVGNSADHRQNGSDHGKPTATQSPAAASGTPVAATSGGSGVSGSGSSGGGNPGKGGGGKGGSKK